MGQRRDRLNKRLAWQSKARRTNSLVKANEQSRRATHIKAILKKGQLPYTPGVMSWLSDQLGKKASRITEADVKSLLQ